jgi:hypothetical protein
MKQLESSKSQKRYGIPMVYQNFLDNFVKPMYYPTACKTPFGTMLIATREIITKEGKVQSVWASHRDFTVEMDRELLFHFGVYRNECRTVQLIASS